MHYLDDNSRLKDVHSITYGGEWRDIIKSQWNGELVPRIYHGDFASSQSIENRTKIQFDRYACTHKSVKVENS